MLQPVAAFLLTVLLEWPVLAWLSRLGLRQTALFCLCLNGASWGAAMTVLACWPDPVPWLEVAIVFVEAAILGWFWRWRPARALGISLAMNLTSWLLGTLLLSWLAPAS